MPDGLYIEPAVLRQLASQHDQVARDTREWAKPPTEWLANFEPTYGKIADPVKRALERYYDARQRAGEALAKEHENTRDSLLAAADAYEQADDDMGRNIARIADPDGPGLLVPAGPTPNGLITPGLDGPTSSGPTPVGAPPGDVSAPAATTATPPPAATSPTGGETMAPAASANQGATTAVPPTGTDGTTGTTTPGASGTPAAAAANGAMAPGGTYGGPFGPSGPSGGPSGPSVGGGGGGGGGDDRVSSPPGGPADGTPIPAVTPFGAAVAAAKDKAAEPDYVVGGAVSDDLVIARTLLSAVLAAAEPAIGMTWAVSVMRGPAGAGVFITSNEGRGWLPAGLFLPREVSTPWLWDELLNDGSHESASPWEGVSDPARVLAEFGLAWGAKANAKLSALVSSGPIDSGLRTRFADVPMEDLVGPAYDLDLRVLTPDTVDRLDLAGSIPAREQVSVVPDANVRSRCVELAVDAQAQLARSATAPVEAAASRGIRDRILAAVQANSPVPRQWWDELQEADDLLAASMISRRVDVGRVGLGELRVDDEVSDLRAMAWERRCNELVALLAQESSRQSLRDAVFAHDQIVNHPAFVQVPPTVAATETDHVARPAAGTGTVSAPEQATAPAQASAPPAGAVSPPPVVAGPPAGAVVPPVTPPDTAQGR